MTRQPYNLPYIARGPRRPFVYLSWGARTSLISYKRNRKQPFQSFNFLYFLSNF
ncbi:hypothetical protein HanRHA438_Chr10g0456731 [Helianthus annuus]|nr:hypothetical protein HanRHA438_Chr10g0456731 [Helianthus annuus]